MVLGELSAMAHGVALASALLLAAVPDRMAVEDSRAHRELERMGVELDNVPEGYWRYMEPSRRSGSGSLLTSPRSESTLE
jgi:hypothetical protein